MKKKKRVLVISRNYNNLLCAARSLAGGDYDIEAVRIVQLHYGVLKLTAKFNPERQCRYIDKYHVCLTDRKPEKFTDFLMEVYDPERETLLVSCDDISLPWIDRNYDMLKNYYVMSNVNNTQGELAKLMNKQYQKELAEKAGLPAPKSRRISIRNGRYEIPEEITYPCFLKPAVLVMGSKDYLGKHDDEHSLKEVLDTMAKKFGDIEVVIEEYIDIKREYAILGVCAGEDVLIPDGCLAFVKGGHGSRKGIMAVGEVVSNPEIRAFISKLGKYLKGLGYTGLFDVDVLESDSGLYFCELNLRFGGSGYAVTQSGVNLPKIFAEHMLQGKPIPEKASLSGMGKKFVSEKIVFEDLAEGFIKKEEAEKVIEEADIHFIMDDSDPGPYKRMRQYFRYTAKVMMKLKELYKKYHH